MNKKFYLDILKNEVKPALGCTEPIAIALASAKAASLLKTEVEHIEVSMSSNIMKNALGVGIPGTGMVGIEIAATLGAIGGDARKSLEVLKSVTEEDIKRAKELVNQKIVKLSLKDISEKLYIEVTCFSKGHSAKVIIKDRHDKITHLAYDGETIFQIDETVLDDNRNSNVDMTVESIYNFVKLVNYDDIVFILEGAKMNKKVAQEGLRKDYGLKVGQTIDKNIKRKILAEDLKNYAMKLAAAASDARMAGFTEPVMTNSGSGNQGITAILPVVAVAEKMDINDEKLARALILSNLISIHIKSKLGRLSALCGATTAAMGAGSAITYLLGGELKHIKATIKNMIGNVSGMFCDGAKTGCALKVATAVGAAVQSSLLALEEIEISKYEGIIEEDIEKCINNIGFIGSKGMEESDKFILDIMLQKN